MRMLMSAPMRPAVPPGPAPRHRIIVASILVKNPTSTAEQEGAGATLDSDDAADQRKETTAEPAPGARTRARRTAVDLPLPEEILVWEIFVRLPAKDVIRCRAVCRSWRRLTLAADFLLAHHQHQPSLPILTLCGAASAVGRLPILERCRPILGLDDYQYFKIHASCDGLLLLSLSDGRFSVCNPATRLCAPLRGLAGLISIVAMYLHRPSAEYRVLYKWRYTTNNSYYILALQRGCPSRWRINGVPSDSQPALRETTPNDYAPPVAFRSCLHWEPDSPADCLNGDASIVVFDTVVESFRFMRRPAGATRFCPRLCNMEGSMGFSCFDDNRTAAKIWVLEDYEREVWSFKYDVKFPVRSLCNFADTRHLVLSHNGEVLVYSEEYMFHCDNTGRLIEEFHCDPWCLSNIGHWFKESLVEHDFFPRRASACARRPSLFHRL